MPDLDVDCTPDKPQAACQIDRRADPQHQQPADLLPREIRRRTAELGVSRVGRGRVRPEKRHVHRCEKQPPCPRQRLPRAERANPDQKPGPEERRLLDGEDEAGKAGRCVELWQVPAQTTATRSPRRSAERSPAAQADAKSRGQAAAPRSRRGPCGGSCEREIPARSPPAGRTRARRESPGLRSRPPSPARPDQRGRQGGVDDADERYDREQEPGVTEESVPVLPSSTRSSIISRPLRPFAANHWRQAL